MASWIGGLSMSGPNDLWREAAQFEPYLTGWPCLQVGVIEPAQVVFMVQNIVAKSIDVYPVQSRFEARHYVHYGNQMSPLRGCPCLH
jgi:hypothetical protein